MGLFENKKVVKLGLLIKRRVGKSGKLVVILLKEKKIEKYVYSENLLEGLKI